MRYLSLFAWGLTCLLLTIGILGGVCLLIWSFLHPASADIFSLLMLPGLFALFLPKARKRFTRALNAARSAG